MPSAEGVRRQARGSGVSGSSPSGVGAAPRKQSTFMHFKSNFEHFETRFVKIKKIKPPKLREPQPSTPYLTIICQML